VDWHLVALFYAVDFAAGSPAVTEVDGSTDAVAWVPLPGLRESVLSPAAVDALDPLDRLTPRPRAPRGTRSR
jgi:hypothetical protein